MSTPDPRRGDEPDLDDSDLPEIEVAQPGRTQPDDDDRSDAGEARGEARP